MRNRVTMAVGLFSLFAAAWLAAPALARAQETPGPLPAPPPQLEPLEPAASRSPEATASTKPIPPRTSIAGAWKLNTDDSDDGRKKVQQAQAKSQGNGGNGGNGGNPRIGGGGNPYPGQGGGNPYPGQGGGGNGGGGRRGGANQPSDMDPRTMRELTDPPETLNIVQKDPKGVEVDLTDDTARKKAFFTDGRKLQKSNDDTYQEIAAKWDGRSLVTDEKTPRGGKFSRTFDLAPNGQQLYETVRIDANAYGGAKSAPQVYIQYVYDADQGDASSR
jgi:hypothetical protein